MHHSPSQHSWWRWWLQGDSLGASTPSQGWVPMGSCLQPCLLGVQPPPDWGAPKLHGVPPPCSPTPPHPLVLGTGGRHEEFSPGTAGCPWLDPHAAMCVCVCVCAMGVCVQCVCVCAELADGGLIDEWEGEEERGLAALPGLPACLHPVVKFWERSPGPFARQPGWEGRQCYFHLWDMAAGRRVTQVLGLCLVLSPGARGTQNKRGGGGAGSGTALV